METYEIFILLTCIGIIGGTFSLYYFIANNSFDNYLNENEYKLRNINNTYFIEAKQQSLKNLSYNPILLKIFLSSIIFIVIYGLLAIYFRKEYLNRSKINLINGESHEREKPENNKSSI